MLDDEALELPTLPRQPGVYQWLFRHEGRERCYVGETEDLAQRFVGYHSPGPTQSTNQRMNERARRVLQANGEAEILVLDTATIVVDGQSAEADLASPFTRKVIENAELVGLLVAGRDVVNGIGYGPLRADDVLR
jgi:hypothetical protein